MQLTSIDFNEDGEMTIDVMLQFFNCSHSSFVDIRYKFTVLYKVFFQKEHYKIYNKILTLFFIIF